jgi:hypothetical protein
VRNIFSLIGFVVVVFLGAGWYLGWYKLDWATGSDGRAKIGLDVDTSKVSSDIKKGGEKVGNFVDSLKSNPSAEKNKQQSEDKNFVGPPIPADWAPPTNGKPAAGLPGPAGFGK